MLLSKLLNNLFKNKLSVSVILVLLASLVSAKAIAHSATAKDNQPVLSNPLEPSHYQQKKTPKKFTPKPLILQSIVRNATNPYAIINDRIYREGQSINGLKIIHIQSDRVKLANGRTLYLLI